MKKILFYLSIVAIPAIAQNPSLQWEKSVNGQASGYEQTSKAWKDQSGNYYITGSSNGDAFVLKVDAAGNQLSKFTYDGPQKNNDVGTAIKADNSGNIYLGGLTKYNNFNTPFLVKFNSNGVKLWEYIQPNLTMDGFLTAIALDNNATPANIYFVGSKNDSASTTKINTTTGTFVWQYLQTLPPGKLNDIDIDNNGRPLVCGYIGDFSNPNNPNLFAAQLDINSGYPQRYTVYDGAVADSIDHSMFATQHFDMATKIKAGPAGTYVVLGNQYDNVGEATIYIYKFGSAGNAPISWYGYNSPNHTEGEGVQLIADASFANFYYIARANSTGGVYNTYTIAGKVNSSGNAVWEKEYYQGYTNLDPQDMALDANGNSHIITNANGTGISADIYYMKLASANGNIASSLAYDNQRGGGNAYDVATNVFLDNVGHPYFFGSSDGYTYTQNDVLMVTLNTNGSLNWDLAFDYFINTQDNVVKAHMFPPVGGWGDQVVTCGTIFNNITQTDASITSYDLSGNVLFQATFDENNGNDEVIGFGRLGNYSNYLCTSGPYNVTITQFYSDGTINGSPQHPAFNLTNPQQFKLDTIGNCFVTAYGLGSDDYNLGILSSGFATINNTPNTSPGNYAYTRDLTGDNLSNVYIAGMHEVGNSPTIRRMMVQKYDISGNKIWSTEIMGLDSTSFLTQAEKIVYDRVGSAVYIAGIGKALGVNELFTVVAKLDLNGNVLWVKKYNGGNTRSENVNDLVFSNGNLYTTGFASTSSNPSDNFVYVEKWDVNGNFIWDKTYNGASANTDEAGTGVAVDNAGNVFISGYGNGTASNQSQYDMLVLKFDASGNQLWKKEYDGGNGQDKAVGLCLSLTNNSTTPRIFVYGNVQGVGGTNSDIATLKYCDLPATHITNTGGLSICQNATTYLSTSGIMGTGSVLWSPGGQNFSTIGANTAGNYYFTYSELDGCSENSDTVTVNLIAPPITPNICMVTVDDSSRHNLILWDKTPYANTGVIGFNIYREDLANIYHQIGSVPFANLSEYVDLDGNANPNVTTKRYKITAVDSCGNESQMSNYHNTIYIVSNGGGQFSWNQLYTIENSPNPVVQYILLRDDYNTGNWHAIDSTAGTQFNINDIQFSMFQPTANWRVVTQWNINCTPTARIGNGNSIQAAIVKSKSNITNNRTADINNLTDKTVGAYPNPAVSMLTITVPSSAKTTLKLMSLVGDEIISTEMVNENSTQIDVSKLASGVYLLEISNTTGKFVKRIVKQ